MVERNKGKSILSVTDDYTVVDLETTGFSSQYNHIIEVGCIRFRAGKEVERYQTLIKPADPIPYVIECMTGIKNDDVKDAPTFNEVGMAIWDFLKGEILVGHNVNFDINFLYDNFQREFNLQFQNDFVDTLRFARILLPDIKKQGYRGHGLSELCDYFDISFFQHHRALADCQMANNVFLSLKELVIRDNVDLVELLKSRNAGRSLKDLKSDGINFDTDNIFFNKCCVFTGKLEQFTRIQAAQIVVNIGGRCEDRITKQTNFLIVGDMDYKKGLEGHESNKLKKAKQLIANKQDLQIIPESAFYDLIADYIDED